MLESKKFVSKHLAEFNISCYQHSGYPSVKVIVAVHQMVMSQYRDNLFTGRLPQLLQELKSIIIIIITYFLPKFSEIRARAKLYILQRTAT